MEKNGNSNLMGGEKLRALANTAKAKISQLEGLELIPCNPDKIEKAFHMLIDNAAKRFWTPGRFGSLPDVDEFIPYVEPVKGQNPFVWLHPIICAIGGEALKIQISKYIKSNHPRKYLTDDQRSSRSTELTREIRQLWVELERGCRELEAAGGSFERPGEMPPEIFLARDLDAPGA